MNSSKAIKMHDLAMAQAFLADLEKSPVEKSRLYKMAMENEAKSAAEFHDRKRYEPTRSILYRSAASLAILAGEMRGAEKLACEGLAGNPPNDIAEELRDVLRKVMTKR